MNTMHVLAHHNTSEKCEPLFGERHRMRISILWSRNYAWKTHNSDAWTTNVWMYIKIRQWKWLGKLALLANCLLGISRENQSLFGPLKMWDVNDVLATYFIYIRTSSNCACVNVMCSFFICAWNFELPLTPNYVHTDFTKRAGAS